MTQPKPYGREFMAADYLRDDGAFVPWATSGYTLIEPLPFLHGREWDDYSLAYVHAIRPSSIRVTNDSAKADSRLWRVTVWLEEGKISSIQQEVSVGLPDGIRGGHGLDQIVRPRH